MEKLLPGLKSGVFLKKLTTFKVGGQAKYFLAVKSAEELKTALGFARNRGLEVFVMGEGSNILVADQGLNALVLKIEIKGIEWREEAAGKVEISASAGENWDKLVEMVVEKNLYGLENLSGIPGSVGAAPVQNIGAYGQELKNIISWVEILDEGTLKARRLSVSECDFSYRDSVFKKEGGKSFIVTKVALLLDKKGAPKADYKDVANHISENSIKELNPKVMRQVILKIRRGKFPDLNEVGTAGSFFKNPIISLEHFGWLKEKFPQVPSYPAEEQKVKIPAAWILDKVCCLKGFRKRDAGLYENQPLVFVNHGQAEAKEIYDLAQWIKGLVKEKTGIELHEEVKLVGF